MRKDNESKCMTSSTPIASYFILHTTLESHSFRDQRKPTHVVINPKTSSKMCR